MTWLAIAAICAALMGFAIQRGGTCLVAALDELVSKRSANRLLALGEASLLVAAGMVVAQLLGVLPMAPRAFEPTGWTIVGGMVMGLGAYVAGACVFGAIARIGNGEPAYFLVPIGFFLGCVAALKLGMTRLPHVSEPPTRWCSPRRSSSPGRCCSSRHGACGTRSGPRGAEASRPTSGRRTSRLE